MGARMLRHLTFALAALGAMASIAPAAAQTPLFSEHSELEILIEGPITTLVRRAANNTDPVPAVLSVAGHPQRWDIQLEPRGFSRRTFGICAFPPLRIDLPSGVDGTLFDGQNRIKIVTRCRSASAYEQLPVLEHIAYRLYNEITPFSYRVRPARITYRDRRDDVQWNFLIEDTDDMARRNGMVELEVAADHVRAAQLDGEAIARYALFQFMIGNLDFDPVSARAGEECCHNSRLIAPSEAAVERIVPVPYDFDYSGFVNAPYAVPPEGLPVRNVRQRHYRGYCRFNDRLPQAIDHFQSRRAQLMALIDGETRLSASRRQAARQYIEGFFAIISDPRRVDRELVQNCRG